MGRYAPIIDRRAGMTQEEINRILRPNKRRFGQSKLPEVTFLIFPLSLFLKNSLYSAPKVYAIRGQQTSPQLPS